MHGEIVKFTGGITCFSLSNLLASGRMEEMINKFGILYEKAQAKRSLGHQSLEGRTSLVLNTLEKLSVKCRKDYTGYGMGLYEHGNAIHTVCPPEDEHLRLETCTGT